MNPDHKLLDRFGDVTLGKVYTLINSVVACVSKTSVGHYDLEKLYCLQNVYQQRFSSCRL